MNMYNLLNTTLASSISLMGVNFDLSGMHTPGLLFMAILCLTVVVISVIAIYEIHSEDLPINALSICVYILCVLCFIAGVLETYLMIAELISRF